MSETGDVSSSADVSSSGAPLRPESFVSASPAPVPSDSSPLERRVIEREWLDELPAGHVGAIRSRRDLRRLNRWMGHTRILAEVLREEFARRLSLQLVEIGAGDGEFLLAVARRLRGQWRTVEAQLVDRLDLLKPGTRTRFADVHWRVQSTKEDAFQWLHRSPPAEQEVVVANLFLHHFREPELQRLFQILARKAGVLIAIEPRRARWAYVFSRMLMLAGCGPVTCHDAPISVRAGFAGHELSMLWPDHANWKITEQPVGRFNHLFIARRTGPLNFIPSGAAEPGPAERVAH